jgi:hypothetical protein
MTGPGILDHRAAPRGGGTFGARPDRILLAALAAAVGLASQARAGETRCWIDKGGLVASARFGDIAGDFLIDLSAPDSQLQDTRAAMAGLEGASATRTLAIAGQTVPDFTMGIADLDARTRRFDTVINGVLGADLMRRFILGIDPAPCRLRLGHGRPHPLPGGVRLRLGDGGDGVPRVAAAITDGRRLRVDDLAIDTADWAGRLGDARPAASPPPGDAARPAPTARLRALELAGRLFEQVPVDTPATGTGATAPGPSGEAIGMAVWSRLRLRLDIQDGWLDVAPRTDAGGRR